MKTVREVMTTDVIWLSPMNKVKTAIILMKGRNIGGLPVLEDEQVVGILDYQDILGKDTDVPVQHIMSREFVTIPPNVPIADAADLMMQIGTGRLLVTEGAKLVGIVTRADIMPEMGKSLDLLTGLPRGDTMRDWGINALKSGREITVIFMDLDQFRHFNKTYGHVTGDKVLKHVAEVFKTCVDEKHDMLCRYAGDEFVVVTTRARDDAAKLAQRIYDSVLNNQNPEIPEPVTVTVGFHGGKRTKEREQVHYEATLDNLINLASKACTSAKKQSLDVVLMNGGAPAAAAETKPVKPVAVPQPAEKPKVSEENKLMSLMSLNVSWDSGSTATVEVEISDGDIACKASKSGFALGNSALRLVAEAAAEALCEYLRSPGYGVVAESVHLISEDSVVLATLLLVTPQKQLRASGSSIIKQDAYRATASAVLNAINSQIGELG